MHLRRATGQGVTQKGMWQDARSTRITSSRDSNRSTASPRGSGASVVTPNRTPVRLA
jgi:hypothetical protein